MESKTTKPATKSENVVKNVEKGLIEPPASEKGLNALKIDLEKAIALLQANSPENALSDVERRRQLGSGVRRYGFIDKVSDFALANPEFIPAYMDEEELKSLIREIELLRDIMSYLQQLLRMTGDMLLVTGTDAYRIALMYYGAVREAANRRAPGADAIFRMLNSFFKRPRRTKDEPTEHELERDLRALLHGHKDGEIIIKNESPHTSGGMHEVIDSVHTGHTAVKETNQLNINE